MQYLGARGTDITTWNFHMKIVVFLATKGGVILWLNASQPISTSFTNGNDNTETNTQPISMHLTHSSQSATVYKLQPISMHLLHSIQSATVYV